MYVPISLNQIPSTFHGSFHSIDIRSATKNMILTGSPYSHKANMVSGMTIDLFEPSHFAPSYRPSAAHSSQNSASFRTTRHRLSAIRSKNNHGMINSLNGRGGETCGSVGHRRHGLLPWDGREGKLLHDVPLAASLYTDLLKWRKEEHL